MLQEAILAFRNWQFSLNPPLGAVYRLDRMIGMPEVIKRILQLVISTTSLALQFSQTYLIQLQIDRMGHTGSAEHIFFPSLAMGLVDSGRGNSWSQKYLILSSFVKGYLSKLPCVDWTSWMHLNGLLVAFNIYFSENTPKYITVHLFNESSDGTSDTKLFG